MNHILQMEKMLYWVTSKDLRSIAYQLDEANRIDHPLDRESELAGADWLEGLRSKQKDPSCWL